MSAVAASAHKRHFRLVPGVFIKHLIAIPLLKSPNLLPNSVTPPFITKSSADSIEKMISLFGVIFIGRRKKFPSTVRYIKNINYYQ